MTRYIDADSLMLDIVEAGQANKGGRYKIGDFWELNGAEIRTVIEAQPTIDAVPKEKILLFLDIANEQLSKAHANKSGNGIMTWSASVTTLEGLLKEYDTADTDIVPVIRCRDCKYLRFTGTVWKCQNSIVMMLCEPNDYCSRAERRGEE